jgi:hypothetical protein
VSGQEAGLASVTLAEAYSKPLYSGGGKHVPASESREVMTAVMKIVALDTVGALEGRELIAWLESPEGEARSRASHIDAARHCSGVFGGVKDDHPGKCPEDGSDIEVANRLGLEILSEITWSGMSGLSSGRLAA